MLRVLSIAHSEAGGGIQTVFRINNEISKSDLEIDVVKAFRSDEKNIADINLKTIDEYKNPIKKICSYFFIPKNYFSIKKYLKENEVDVIHIHSSLSLSLSILMAIKRFKGNAKVIQSTHGYGLVCPIYSCYNYQKETQCHDCIIYGKEFRVIKNKCDRRGYTFSLVRYIDFLLRKKVTNDYKLYDYIVTPSEYLRNLLLKSKHKFSQVRVVPNPIEIKENLINPDSKKDVITYLGRFSKEKNIGMLIDAFAQAKQRNSNLFLNILGDGNEKKNYLDKIKEYGLESSVYVSERFLNQEEFKKILLNSKVLALPSVVPETFGLVLFEGIRCGLIPVSLNIGAQSENINKVGLGILYNKNETSQLEQAINEAINNYEQLITTVKEANSKIDTDFSVETYYKNIFDVYKDAINRKRI